MNEDLTLSSAQAYAVIPYRIGRREFRRTTEQFQYAVGLVARCRGSIAMALPVWRHQSRGKGRLFLRIEWKPNVGVVFELEEE